MRITELHVHGFGHFHDYEVTSLSSGLTLFEGHNETGKSTLMAFVRAVLFGFEGRKSGNNRYEPLKGGRHGGALSLINEKGERYYVQRSEGGAFGRVKISGPDGQARGGEILHQLLSGTSKTLYQNVFAFGLTELQRLESLQDDEVNHHIYTAGLGTGSVSFANLIQQLEDEQEHLFKPSGKKPVINILLSKLDETHGTIGRLQKLPESYTQLQDELAKVDLEIQEHQGQLETVQAQVKWLETLLKAKPDWDRRNTLQQDLHEQPRIEAFPEGGIERLQQLKDSLASLHLRKPVVLQDIQDIEYQQSSLQVDSNLLQHEESIRTLERKGEQFRKQQDRLPLLLKKVEQQRKDLDAIFSRLGPPWNDEYVTLPETQFPTTENIREYQQRFHAAQEKSQKTLIRLESAERQWQEKETEITQLRAHIASSNSTETASPLSLEEREKALRNWVKGFHQLEMLLQRQQELRERGTPLAEHIEILDEELSILERQNGVPIWMIMAVGVTFGSLAVFTFSQNLGLVTMVLLACGVVISGFLVWRRDTLKNEQQSREADVQQQHGRVITQARILQLEADKTSQDIQGILEHLKSDSLSAIQREMKEISDAEEVHELLRAERRLQERKGELEVQLQTQHTVLETLQAEHESASHQVQECEQFANHVHTEWNQYLRNYGLPDHLNPEQVLEMLAHKEHALVTFNAWKDNSHLVSQELAESHDFLRHFNSLLASLDRPPIEPDESSMALAMLEEVYRDLETNVKAQQTLSQRQSLLNEKNKEHTLLEESLNTIQKQISDLLKNAEASDEAKFRERAQHYKKQVNRDQEIQRLASMLAVHAGSQKNVALLEEQLTNHSLSDFEEQYNRIREEKLFGIQTQVTHSLQEKGRLQQQLENLEHDAQLSETLLEHQTLLTQLDRTVHQWAIRTTTRFLLEKARLVYERDRQPAVLRYASDFFSTMTQGRYNRVKVPLGESRLEVEGQTGHPQGTERLSRGTAEQLYLAMRLAFVREYATHAGILPLVMDDIFVNFDPERAKAAIEVLREFSQTHQILFFTCHPHVRQWFREIIPDVPIRSLAIH